MSNDSSSPKPKTRRFTSEEKARILAEYEAATTPLERASLMRREGVYSSLLSAWRQGLRKATATSPPPPPGRGRPAATAQSKELEHLRLENASLRARAEQAESLVETLGKVPAVLIIRPHKVDHGVLYAHISVL
jgi:transposase